MGAVVFSYDMIGYGDQNIWAGNAAIRKRSRCKPEQRRAIDFLETLPDVDGA